MAVQPTPYRSLPVERRIELVKHVIASGRDGRAFYIQRLAAKNGFRPMTLQSWPADKLAKEVVRTRAETAQDELNLLHLLYVESFERLRAGYGAAITVVYLLLLLSVTAGQRLLSGAGREPQDSQRKQTRRDEGLGQPGVAIDAPARTPAIANQDRRLVADRPERLQRALGDIAEIGALPVAAREEVVRARQG